MIKNYAINSNLLAKLSTDTGPDWVDESIAEFLDVAEQIGLDKRHHSVILFEIVLQRCASERNASLGLHLSHCLGNFCIAILDHVSLVAYDEIGPRRAKIPVGLDC